MKRIDIYIMRQLGLSLIAVTVGLAALVWLTQSLRFIELVLDRGLSIWVFLELTGLLLPSFFGVILPITAFVVTLFNYVRLSSDRELVVMRAAGLSNWQLAKPALGIAGLATCICFILNIWITPRLARILPRVAVRDPQPDGGPAAAGGRVQLGRRRPHRLCARPRLPGHAQRHPGA
ncbi:LptF/LptG family permease [Roseococcus sp.]|uniref:LptF/LptG family permease n=1 Tax=Roseococcus sp. TaxID=2109646 RepID=UPI003BAA501C